MNSLSETVEPCLDECKHEKLCWFRNSYYDLYKECVDSYVKKSDSTTNKTNVQVYFIALIIFIYSYIHT